MNYDIQNDGIGVRVEGPAGLVAGFSTFGWHVVDPRPDRQTKASANVRTSLNSWKEFVAVVFDLYGVKIADEHRPLRFG